VGIQDLVRTPTFVAFIACSVMLAIVSGLCGGVAAVVAARRRRQAVVGGDGVTLRKGRRATFVPYDAVARVEADARGVVLHRHQGPAVVLPTRGRGEAELGTAAASGSDAARRQQVLHDRIHDAARARRFGSRGLEVLDRRGRPISEWLDEVRTMTSQDRSYRAETLSAADFADVAEDVSAPPERRIAAAMAVGTTADPAAKSRLRIAIDTCADDDLRVALEQAAALELEEAELERATRGR
jgi:hypothetical protein